MAKKSIASKSRYNIARNAYCHSLKTKKVNYFAAVFGECKKDHKETCKNINRILAKSEVRTCSSLVVNNHISTDLFAMANHYNNHFVSVASKLTKNLPTKVTQKIFIN